MGYEQEHRAERARLLRQRRTQAASAARQRRSGTAVMDASDYAPYMPETGPPRMYWCAVLNGPTRLELDAGIDLTQAVTRWEQTGEDHFTLQFDQCDALTVRGMFPRGTAGHLVLLPVGDLPGGRMDIWPVSADAPRVVASIDPLLPHLEISLRITARPRRKVLIPAFS